MKKQLMALMVAGLFIPGLSFSDTIFGVYAGVGVWSTDVEGDFEYVGGAVGDGDIDLADDLDMDGESNSVMYVAVEHPLPFVPNVKVQRSEMTAESSTILSSNITFDGVTYPVSDSVETTLDLSHTDATLYYEVLDNWVSIDLGLSVRVFDGEIDIQSVSTPSLSSNVDLNAPIPMLYGKARFDLPFTGGYASAEINTLGVVSDTTFTVGYESAFRFGVEAGYRIFSVSLDDIDDLDTGIDIDGAYIALTLHI